MSVIIKKDEKVNSVLDVMINSNDIEEFKCLFKDMYPTDWERISKKLSQTRKKRC